MGSLNHSKIQKQLATQLLEINGNKNKQAELWMFFDSGASRSVISTTSPVRKHLQAIGPAYGSCSIGDGAPLQYLEKGKVTDALEVFNSNSCIAGNSTVVSFLLYCNSCSKLTLSGMGLTRGSSTPIRLAYVNTF